MKFIKISKRKKIYTIALNRPEKRNALNEVLVEELKQCVTEAENDANVKVVIIKAMGEVFCAGADLAYLQQMQNYSYDENLKDSN